MKASTYMARRAAADALANEMVEVIKSRAISKYNCEDGDVYTFATGYLTSLVSQLASKSPTAMKSLADTLKYAKEQA